MHRRQCTCGLSRIRDFLVKIPAAFCYAVDWAPKEMAKNLILVLHFMWWVFWFCFCFKHRRMWSPASCCFCHCRKWRRIWRKGLRKARLLLLLLPTLWPDLGQADLMLKLDTSAEAALCSGLCFQRSDIWRTANLVLSRSLCTFLSLTSPAPWSLALTDPWESPIYPIPFPVSYHMLPVFLLMMGATWTVYAGVLNISNFSSGLTKSFAIGSGHNLVCRGGR